MPIMTGKTFARRAARRALVVAGLALAPALIAEPLPAGAASPVEAFVESDIQTGLGILQDKSLSDADRRAHIRDFLQTLLDTRRIGLYALGPAQQTASPADIADYAQAFHDFMIESYVSRLGGYEGQTLKITGSVERSPGDFVVTTLLVDPSASPGGEAPPEVDLRIVDEGGKFFVVDASIEGIWLAIAQHDDFVGFLKQHDESVPALTAHLKDMTAKLLASSGTPAQH